jgi:hypothetical protein
VTAADDDESRAALSFATSVLGPLRLVRDWSWPHRESTVLEVVDGTGERWIAKRCRHEQQFRQETTAYRDWVPCLAGKAPVLVADDPVSRTMLMTREPGTVNLSAGPSAHRLAGALLRRLHCAADGWTDAEYAERMRERLDDGLRRGVGLFERRDVDFVRSQVRSLAGLPAPAQVPTHQDNQPRNWLLDDAGEVRLIDFGLSRRDVWVKDLLRLHAWDWQHDAELRTAFMEGYGRTLHEDDRQLIRVIGALTAIMTVLWAHEHGAGDFAARGWRALEVARAEA